jgi:hypothetical protein
MVVERGSLLGGQGGQCLAAGQGVDGWEEVRHRLRDRLVRQLERKVGVESGAKDHRIERKAGNLRQHLDDGGLPGKSKRFLGLSDGLKNTFNGFVKHFIF